LNSDGLIKNDKDIIKGKMLKITLFFALLPAVLLLIGILLKQDILSFWSTSPGSAVVPTAPTVVPTAPENSRSTYLIATMIYLLIVVIISGFLNSPDLPKSIFTPHTPWQAGWRMALINAFPIFSFAYYMATGKFAFLAITAIAAFIAVMMVKSRIEFDNEVGEPDKLE